MNPRKGLADLQKTQSKINPMVCLHFLCVFVHGNTAADMCCTEIISFLSLFHPQTLFFNHISTAFIQGKNISALTFCTQILILQSFSHVHTVSFLFNLFGLLGAVGGVCFVSPATVNSVQGCECISINTSMCQRHSYCSSTQPAGHL